MEKIGVAIIGAGMSGLAAGIRLAQYDQNVTIFDRHSVWGGLNSFYKKDGHPFDVGLHAMTNFAKKGDKKGPLPKVLRQLRLDIDELDLKEQDHSLIHFPSARLTFNNDIGRLTSEISEKFPDEIDGFRKLCQAVKDHDDGSLTQKPIQARDALKEYLKSNLLMDMIRCPLMFYGSAVEEDMDWNQFVIMFKAIYFDGFSRPHEGVRKILSLLVNTFKERGGQLRMRTGIEKLTPRAEGGVLLRLENGEEVLAEKVLSSAGYFETLKLLGEEFDPNSGCGRMSFVETIFCLDREPRELDITTSIQFFSKRDDFQYRRPGEAVDFQSGILCSPNNFKDTEPLDEGLLRLTNIANFDIWKKIREEGESAYLNAKEKYIQEQITCLKEITSDFSKHIRYVDSFTPLTIEKFTSHISGAVYGAQEKHLNGEIGQKDVFLCGTDQGYLGIVGAMLSGVIMANRHVLM